MEIERAVFLTTSLRWSTIAQTAPFGRVRGEYDRDVFLREIFLVQRKSLSKRRDGSRNTMRNDAPPWKLKRLSTRHFVEESRHVLRILKLSSYMYISGSCEKLRRFRAEGTIESYSFRRIVFATRGRACLCVCVCVACVCACVCVFYVMIVLYLLLMLNLYIHC